MTEFPQFPQLVYTSKSKTLITTTTTSKFSTYACIRIHACVRIYIYIYKKTGKMSTCMQVDVLTVDLWVVDTLPVGHFTGRKSGLHFAEKISSLHFAGKIHSTLCRRYHFSSRHFGSRHFDTSPYIYEYLVPDFLALGFLGVLKTQIFSAGTLVAIFI